MSMLDVIRRVSQSANLDAGTLRQIAQGFFLPLYARQFPVSPLTKGTNIQRWDANKAVVGPFDVTFSYAVLLTGVTFTLSTDDADDPRPNIDDELYVQLQVYDGEEKITSNEQLPNVSNSFVPVRSLDLGRRSMLVPLDLGSNGYRVSVSFTSRWALAGAAGNGFGGDMLVDATFLATPLV